MNVEAAYDEYLSECYPETTKIGWVEVDTVTAIKTIAQCDYEMSQSDWALAEEEEEIFVSFDNGSTYYRTFDVQKYIDDNE